MNYLKIIKSLKLDAYKCDFLDIRAEEKSITSIYYENHNLVNASNEPNMGVFIRVYHRGRWFYTSLNSFKKSSIEKAIKDLLKIAGSHKGAGEKFYSKIKPFEKSIILYKNKYFINRKINAKKRLLEKYDSITKNYTDIKMVQSFFVDKSSTIYYGNSKGVFYSYDYNGGQIRVVYVFVHGKTQFVDNFSHYSDDFNALNNLEKSIVESIEESKTFVNAGQIKGGVYTVVLSPDAAGVFAHESFGHKSEADFMLEDEGMKKEWKIGKKVGSSLLSIIDYGGMKRTTGYVPFDDEGTPARKTYLIKNGILKGRLHSLKTAYHLKEKPTGNGRAVTTNFEPIVRMTSTYIDKGTYSFDELIKSIKNGIYIKTIKHGSGLSTFTIAPLRSYLIKNGKIDKPVKINVITGNVLKTLNLIDGCSNEVEIKSSLMGGCGKMDQSPLRVSYGGPFVRVKKMNVN